MQTISQNRVSQGKHGKFNAVDIDEAPDPDFYAPEDITITFFADNGNAGLQIQAMGANGRHGFAHTDPKFKYVKVGDKLKRGQKLGRMGYTGLTIPDNVPEGTHVHWTLLSNGVYVYPLDRVNEPFIKFQGDNLMDREEVKLLFWMIFDQDPDARQYAYFTGKDKNFVLKNLFNSTKFKNRQKKVREALGNSTEDSKLGQALKKLIATFGYRKEK